ncbi:hypothetical protein DFH06DRAFT_210475 [Mycena polygramma]|nr:hypothetical protein DFH06DRAFT_210475 [Mycena polygramma]
MKILMLLLLFWFTLVPALPSIQSIETSQIFATPPAQSQDRYISAGSVRDATLALVPPSGSITRTGSRVDIPFASSATSTTTRRSRSRPTRLFTEDFRAPYARYPSSRRRLSRTTTAGRRPPSTRNARAATRGFSIRTS